VFSYLGKELPLPEGGWRLEKGAQGKVRARHQHARRTGEPAAGPPEGHLERSRRKGGDLFPSQKRGTLASHWHWGGWGGGGGGVVENIKRGESFASGVYVQA